MFENTNSWFSGDIISLCKLGFRHVGAHASCEIVSKSRPFLSAYDQSPQIIHLSIDISQKTTQNHKMRYQCIHPTVKISNATSESAILRKFLWLEYIGRP